MKLNILLNIFEQIRFASSVSGWHLRILRVQSGRKMPSLRVRIISVSDLGRVGPPHGQPSFFPVTDW